MILTKKEIAKSQDFSGKLVLPHGYEYWTIYPGGDKLSYFLFDKEDNIIFSGDNYRPSPLYKSIDCLESVIGGLSFLTLQEGAVDDGYFENYTPAQIAFRDSDECEEINFMIWDYENSDSSDPDTNDCHIEAKKYFEANYFQDLSEVN